MNLILLFPSDFTPTPAPAYVGDGSECPDAMAGTPTSAERRRRPPKGRRSSAGRNVTGVSPRSVIDHSKKVRLTGRRLKHVLDVHKAVVGDKLCVGVVDDSIGTGRITVLNKNALEMDVFLKNNPPKALPVTLVLALPRPLMLKRILFSAASMGVKKIILLHTRRVEKSFWQSSALDDAKIKEQLVLGLEQARDTVMPEVLLRRQFKPFLEDELPELIKGTRAFVAHPESPQAFPAKISKPVTLFIGPEGGLIPYEIEKLTSCGFKAVNIGERILRTETAVVSLLSRI